MWLIIIFILIELLTQNYTIIIRKNSLLPVRQMSPIQCN